MPQQTDNGIQPQNLDDPMLNTMDQDTQYILPPSGTRSDTQGTTSGRHLLPATLLTTAPHNPVCPQPLPQRLDHDTQDPVIHQTTADLSRNTVGHNNFMQGN